MRLVGHVDEAGEGPRPVVDLPLLAAAGLALAPRLPLALALTLPWLHGARRRLWLSDGRARHMPLLAAIDAVEVAAVVRGGVRYRVAVI